MVERLREVLAVEVSDGVVFDVGSIEGREITVDATYVGVRVTFVGDLAGMVLRMQVDVGFGDAVVPEPRWVDYPQLLDVGAPRLLGYPAEATLAEKLHAIVVLGLANSRMKDYYDMWTASRLGVDTFARRNTALPAGLPEGLTSSFAADPTKQAQWAGFLRKSRLEAPPLAEVVEVAAGLSEAGLSVARRTE